MASRQTEIVIMYFAIFIMEAELNVLNAITLSHLAVSCLVYQMSQPFKSFDNPSV